MITVQRWCWTLVLLIAVSWQSAEVTARQVEEIHFIGPDGGIVSHVEFAPGRPEVIYALGGGLTDDRLLFKSTDAGATWRDVTPTFALVGRGTYVYLSRNDPDILFFGGAGGTVTRSADAGQTWQPYYTDSQHRVFFVDPDRPDTLLAYTSTGAFSNTLFRSTDGGAAWRESINGIDDIDGRSIRVFINRQATTRLVALVTCCGDVFISQAVYVSANGGARWVRIETGVRYIEGVVFDPSDEHTVYVMPHEGLRRSTDGGETWTDLDVPLPQSPSRRLAIAPGESTILYYAPRDDQNEHAQPLYKSNDQGNTWLQAGTIAPIYSVAGFAIHPQFAGEMFAGGEPYALLHSRDGGQTWEIRNKGLALTRVKAITAVTTETLVAVVDDRGVMYTPDGGQTWKVVIPYTLGIGTDAHVVASRQNPEVLVSNILPDSLLIDNSDWRGQGGVGVSRDGGRTWAFRQAGPRGLSTFGISGDGTTIYGGGAFNVLRKSTDGGRTWERITLDEAITRIEEIEVDPGDLAVVYAQIRVENGETTRLLVRSADGGQTWKTLAEGLDRFFLNKTHPAYLYYIERHSGGASTFYISEDRGASWFPATAYPDSSRFSDLLAHPETPDVLYATTTSGRIVWSQDNGRTWAPITDETHPYAEALGLPATNPSALFVATSSHGIMRLNLADIETARTEPGRSAGRFRLLGNFPNPFQAVTTIEYELAEPALITLQVVDLLGRRIQSLVQNTHHAGRHQVRWDGRDASGREVPSGLYFVELRADSFHDVRPLLVVR